MKGLNIISVVGWLIVFALSFFIGLFLLQSLSTFCGTG